MLTLTLCLGQAKDNEEEEAYDSEDDDNTSSRFIDRLLHFLLKGFEAKDKVVRFRSVQIVATTLPYIGELECVYVVLHL